jgi:hypothetical protein
MTELPRSGEADCLAKELQRSDMEEPQQASGKPVKTNRRHVYGRRLYFSFSQDKFPPRNWRKVMSNQNLLKRAGFCNACGATNYALCDAEIVLSSPYLRRLDSDPLYLVEQPLVCLNCGFFECRVPAALLPTLRNQATLFES